MAGQTLGAPAPLSLSSPHPVVKHAPRLVPASTRTRRNHGVFLLGHELASVYSSRRDGDGLGVTMTVGNGSLQLSGSMTAVQARAMAKALTAAADAVAAKQGGAA